MIEIRFRFLNTFSAYLVENLIDLLPGACGEGRYGSINGAESVTLKKCQHFGA
jgi:hypothetical protein